MFVHLQSFLANELANLFIYLYLNIFNGESMGKTIDSQMAGQHVVMGLRCLWTENLKILIRLFFRAKPLKGTSIAPSRLKINKKES